MVMYAFVKAINTQCLIVLGGKLPTESPSIKEPKQANYRQWRFGGLEMQTFENRFYSASFF